MQIVSTAARVGMTAALIGIGVGCASHANPTTSVPRGFVAAGRVCDLYAAPGGSDRSIGTRRAPFATPQRLFDALRPGRTGCLRGGEYRQPSMRLRHGGHPGARITLRGYPGETARIVLRRDMLAERAASYVTIRDLAFTSDPAGPPLSEILLRDAGVRNSYVGNDISGGKRVTCVGLGEGRTRAVGTNVRWNVLRDCGDRAHRNQDHGVYAAGARGVAIRDNLIWNSSGYGIHLYPDADATTVVHNVIDGSGSGGVIIASDDWYKRSDDNLIAHNIVTSSAGEGITHSWGRAGAGARNRVERNCVHANGMGDIRRNMPRIAVARNLQANPEFRDPRGRDYRLRSTSPCLRVVLYDTAARLARRAKLVARRGRS